MKKFFLIWALLTASCRPEFAGAQLEIAADNVPRRIFPGAYKSISVAFHNPNKHILESDIRTQIFQTSSATAMLLSEKPWKKLQVLAGQTVVESTPFEFPNVRAETKFFAQWLDGTNGIIGRTEVLVYPTNLLEEFKPLLDKSGSNLGVLDPGNQLKPALRHAAIDFVDLAETELDAFTGKLALVGPCGPADPERIALADRIRNLARKGTPVVWIELLPQERNKIWPSFYTVHKNRAAVVVVQPELVADLPDNPQSQLNLIYFCRMALNPQPPALPDLSAQP